MTGPFWCSIRLAAPICLTEADLSQQQQSFLDCLDRYRYLATKPHVLTQVLPQLRRLVAADTLFVSVVAGWPIASLQELLGSSAKIMRAMPNIAAAVQRSSTAAVSGPGVTAEQRVRLRAAAARGW